MGLKRRIVRGLAGAGLAAAGLAGAGPAWADVKAGVDAWTRGDYAAAVREWQGPADTGDADARFNLAQAYRLGRGVPADLVRAKTLYGQAARQGHLRASDNYGILLFQDGERDAALPYLEAAAGRGDPRAQYLLGIAHFNGDLVAKDWVRAYALLQVAQGAGLPQAAPALAQMDGFIPLAQRQQAAGLAQELKTAADARRAQQLAAADLGLDGPALPPVVTASQAPPPRIARAGQQQQPIATSARPAAGPASVSAPTAAAAGRGNPVAGGAAQAGADFSRPRLPASQPAPVATRPATPIAQPRQATPAHASAAPAPGAVAPSRSTAPANSVSRSGPYKVQLGAFSVAGNAERLWTQLSGNPAIAGHPRLLLKDGRITRVLADGFASQDAADAACAALKRGGHSCLVTR